MLKFGLKNRTITTQKKAFVVGILNVTPDSFYEKSRGGVEKAFQLINDGADILDIGAESTRPGFTEVPVDEEINRIIPVLKEIRKVSDIPISIDTRKSRVFEACYNEGADIINDVASFEFDPNMASLAGKLQVPVILTHIFHGIEAERKTDPEVLKTLSDYFEDKMNLCRQNGIAESKVIIDPGIGFGKTFEENMKLITECGKLCDGKYNIMMALSRKRCIGQMMGDMSADRLEGTLKADLLAIESGARFIRVHDVLESVRSLQ